KSPIGVSYGADQSRSEVGLSANVVQNLPTRVTHQQPVDGEIAAGYVLLGCLGIDDSIGMPSIGITQIRAKRRNFHFALLLLDQNHSKLRANPETPGEQFH